MPDLIGNAWRALVNFRLGPGNGLVEDLIEGHVSASSSGHSLSLEHELTYGEVDEFLSLFPVPDNPECNLNLELCKRLFSSDHVDDSLRSPELIQRVGYVPCCVEGGSIGSDEGERGNLESGAYAQFLAQSEFFNRLGYVKFQCSSFVEGESGFFEAV